MGNQDQDGAFDANAFEKQQDAEKLEAAKQHLTTPVTAHHIEGTEGETPITQLDIISTQWRQTATRILKVINPEAYAKYREMKYAGGPSPDHATRMKAYEYAVIEFLHASYKLANF
jgi:hypothetical protein